MLLVLLPMPGTAAGTAYIGVGPGSFGPDVLLIDPGTTIAFDWVAGTHRVVAYRNATFDSGERQSPFMWQIPFDGDTVRYRCTLHSSLNAVGQCHGMCGILTDDPDLDLQKPLAWITRPRRNDVVLAVPTVDPDTLAVRYPVRIEGMATDNVAVAAVGIRWYDNLGRSFQAVADCPACGNPVTTWAADVSLLPGTYLVEAAAVDTSGNQFITPRTMFIVV